MVSVASPPVLNATEQAAVRALATEIEQRDGAPPLSDQALSQLGSSTVIHLIERHTDRDTARDNARIAAAVVGYAQLDANSAEVLAAGNPSQLLDELEARAAHFDLWAHGAASAVGAAARERGYEKVRVLWQLRRPLGDVEPAPVPDGVTIRAFVVGQDEQAWLAVNSAAFAHHAEQGHWTLADLRARENEPWFDPSGFLLAEHNGAVVAFHWTKIHPDGLGEVYVLGVDPSLQGLHLGKALLAAGLSSLADRGVREVLLYVDEDNTTAMRLYERTGFVRHTADVQYRYQHRK